MQLSWKCKWETNKKCIPACPQHTVRSSPVSLICWKNVIKGLKVLKPIFCVLFLIRFGFLPSLSLLNIISVSFRYSKSWFYVYFLWLIYCFLLTTITGPVCAALWARPHLYPSLYRWCLCSGVGHLYATVCYWGGSSLCGIAHRCHGYGHPLRRWHGWPRGWPGHAGRMGRFSVPAERVSDAGGHAAGEAPHGAADAPKSALVLFQ